MPASIAGVPAWLTLPDWRDTIGPVLPWAAAFQAVLDPVAAGPDGTLGIASGTPYALWIDGELIGSGPARDVPARRWLDAWPVGDRLRRGRGVVAILVQPATGALRYEAPETRIGLWVEGCGAERACWRAAPAVWARTGGRWSSSPVGWQDHAAEASAPPWRTEAMAWPPAQVLGGAGTPPWGRPRPRPVPLLDEAPLAPVVVWRGSCTDAQPDDGADLARWFNQAEVAGDAVAGGGDEWALGAGEVLAVDLGRTRMARWGVHLLAAAGPVRVAWFAATALAGRPRAGLGFGSAREGYADRVRLAPGQTWWRSQPRGARFVAIAVDAPCRLRIGLRRIDFPYRAAAVLSAPDPFLAACWRTSAANLASSSLDALVDTCHREQVVWTMDACVAGAAGFALHGDARLWRRSLDLIGRGIDGDGVPQAVVPAAGSVLPDQTCWWVRSLVDCHDRTGDGDLLAEAAPAVRRFLRFLGGMLDHGAIVPPDWCWHFIDWAVIDKRPWSFPINALAADAAAAGLAIADRIGDAALAEQAGPLAAALRAALPRFAAADGVRMHVPAPGAAWPLPPASVAPHDAAVDIGIHAQALAVELGVGGAAARSALARLLVQPPRRPDNGFAPGWAGRILGAASAAGLHAEAWGHVCALYGPYLDAGCPTWPEAFRDPAAAVANTAHGWGAGLASWIVGHGVGLRWTAPGRVRIAPAPWFHGEYRLDLPGGPLRIVQDGGLVQVELPAGVHRDA